MRTDLTLVCNTLAITARMPQDMDEAIPLLYPSLNITLKWYHIIILLSIDMLGPFASDAYLPALPQVQQDLNTSQFLTSLTIQVNVAISGAATLLLGSISDKIGRRKVIQVGLLIFCIGTVGCSLSQNICVLIFSRILQGIGEGIAALAQAVIRDVEDDMQKRMWLMSIFAGLRPIVVVTAPILGGGLSSLLGWRMLFIILTGWGVITLIGTISLPETKSSTQYQGTLIHKLKTVLKEKSFIQLTLTRAFQFSTIFSMLSVISFVFLDFYGQSQFMTGVYTGAIPLTGVIATVLAAELSSKFDAKCLLESGIAVSAISIPLLILCGITWYKVSLFYILVCSAAFISPAFFTTPALMTLLLEPFKDISGFATGLHNFTWKMFSISAALITSFLYSGIPDVMLFSMAVLISCSVFSYTALKLF